MFLKDQKQVCDDEAALSAVVSRLRVEGPVNRGAY